MQKEKFLKILNLIKKQNTYNNRLDNLLDEVNGAVKSTLELDKYTRQIIYMYLEDNFNEKQIEIINDYLYPIHPYTAIEPMKFFINKKEIEVFTDEHLYDILQKI